METKEKQPIWKQAVAIAISMLFLFLVIYIASRAWKKGQSS
jgi:uncharacterized protein YpmS